MLRLITLIGLLGVGNTAMAEPVRMSGDDIKRAMPGALLEIDTPLRISIPVKVGTDGLVSAEAGALGLTLGATKDRGRWWTEGDKLCMKWFRWFDAKPRCMVLLREGNRVQWSEGSGESGTATITEAAPVVAAVEPRHIPKKQKPIELVETAAAPEPAPEEIQVAEAPALPSVEAADAPAPQVVAPTSDKSPALQFAAAALSQVLPLPAEAKPSKLGMSDTPTTEEPAPPVSEVTVQAAAQLSRPYPSARPSPPPSRCTLRQSARVLRFRCAASRRQIRSRYPSALPASSPAIRSTCARGRPSTTRWSAAFRRADAACRSSAPAATCGAPSGTDV